MEYVNSYIGFLSSQGILDDDTCQHYLQVFELMEDDANLESTQEFETKAIFSLADYLKELEPHQHYDISYRLF